MSLQNITIVGAGGKLGAPLVRALALSSRPKFNVLTISRPTSNYSPPAAIAHQVKAVKVDFGNHTQLVESLKGQDAIVLTITANPELPATSKQLIDAAVDAGVKLVIPSDYGNDSTPASAKLFQSKSVVEEQLQKLAAENKIAYTSIHNGPWFDLALPVTMGFDLAARKATLYANGESKTHTTTTDSMTKAIVSILDNPTPYANKTLHIHDFFVSQNEILAAAEEVTGEKFDVEYVDVEALARAGAEKLMQGQFSLDNFLAVLRATVWGPEGAARWDENDDSASLGVSGKDLKEEIGKLVATSSA